MAIALFRCKECGYEFNKWYRTDKHIRKTRRCPACPGTGSFVKAEPSVGVASGIKRHLV